MVMQVGDVIENPIQKYRVKFLEVSDAILKIEWTIEVGGDPTPWHIHLLQDEHFTIQSGQLAIRHLKYDNITILNPNDEYHIKASEPHQFYNTSDTEPVTFIFDITPAGNFATFLVTHFGLSREGKLYDNGMPKDLLQGAVLADIADTYPVAGTFLAYIVKYVLKIPAGFARLIGYKTLPDRFKS